MQGKWRCPARSNRLSFGAAALLLRFSFLGMLVFSRPVQAKNIVLMISDNHTWLDCGCYGSKNVKTPHIDRLASEGVRFKQAFATTASCGPSRAVIYTGLLTHSNGQYAHPHREHNQELRPDVTTVFEMLKLSGYRTALLGKDHIRPLEKYPLDLHNRRDSRDPVILAERAKAFMAESADSPFFLVVSFSDPHPTSLDKNSGWGIKTETPGYDPVSYDPEKITVPGFLPDEPFVREGLAGYYQQISRMDHGVGLVLDAIEETGRRDDTLVLFISDHGTSEPGAMGTHYEPGVRVPFIVRNPRMEEAGLTHQALVTFADITPTILDWSGAAFDEYPLHGRSFLSILHDPQAKGWDYALLSHVGHDVFAHYPMRTIRGQRYKLIWNIIYGSEYPLPIDTVQRATWVETRKSGSKMIGPRSIQQFLQRPQLELYDLETDPWETKNLAEKGEHGELKSQLVAEMMARLEAQADPWLRKYHPLKPGQ